MTLLQLLHQRRQLAEAFSKDFKAQVEDDLRHYENKDRDITDNILPDLSEGFQKRYYFPIPLIFTNHESFMASMFDRAPDLIFRARGKDDDEKKKIVEAVYQYLVDKLDLESFMNDGAWWYALSGFVSSHVGYDKKTREVPIIDENGQQQIGLDGKPLTRMEYEEDDPFIEVGDPKKESFSPESKFSVDGKFVPYYVRHELLEKDFIYRTYKKKVEADAVLENADRITDDDKSDGSKSDTERVKTWRYYGTLPKSVSGEVDGWDADKVYGVIFTQKTILAKDQTPLNDKQCRILKLHGAPNKFYGFGLGKLLRPMQKEKSMRRGQQARYADMAAYPKLLAHSDTQIDKKTMRDPREGLLLAWKGDVKPEYISPPAMGNIVNDANTLADQDAQQASGLLDLSTGSQQSTVDTATGQTIFADAAEKRIKRAKKKFIQWYKENVILLLKMCQLNWDSEKVISITDDKEGEREITVERSDLQDIDFDKDIDIDAESVSINKDVLRQQAIVMYDKTKDDPIVNRREVFSFMLQEGFQVVNPDRFIKNQALQPGMQLINPQTGEQFIVDESGEVMSAHDAKELSQPSGETGVPGTQAGVMAGAQNVGQSAGY